MILTGVLDLDLTTRQGNPDNCPRGGGGGGGGGGGFNINQYKKSYCGDKTILRPSYLHIHNGISYT